jgi:hypothetical protein
MSIILNGTTGITAPAGTLNRSGDGDIITLEKDGVYKGLIGINGNDPYFGRRAGVGITAQNNKIRPADGDDGSGYDNAVDLGEPSYRFKNLYLSGGVYVGGTGSANYLDDYEEGTWTPALSFGFATTGITYSVQSGGYVKVGGQVTVWARLALSNRGSATGAVRVTGLPFTNVDAPGRSEGATAAFNYWGSMAGTPIPLGYVQNNNTTIYLVNGVASNSIASLSESNFSNSSSFYFNATYSTV